MSVENCCVLAEPDHLHCVLQPLSPHSYTKQDENKKPTTTKKMEGWVGGKVPVEECCVLAARWMPWTASRCPPTPMTTSLRCSRGCRGCGSRCGARPSWSCGTRPPCAARCSTTHALAATPTCARSVPPLTSRILRIHVAFFVFNCVPCYAVVDGVLLLLLVDNC